MIMRIIQKSARVAWFLPGFLLWAAYPPMGEHLDAVFAIAPLMWASRRSDARTSARRWFASGLLFWVATLSWMPAIIKNDGPWPLVVLGWFGLAAYCSAYFAAYGYLSAKAWWWARGGGYPRRLVTLLLVEPVLWAGLELVRSRLFGGFAWNQLGVVAVNAGFGSPAALGGVYLCSAAMILLSGTIAGIAERFWRPELSGFSAMRRLGTIETMLAFLAVWGTYSLSSRAVVRPAEDGDTLKVAMVQRNFECVFRAAERESPRKVYGALLENVAALRPDLTVLSESAMCEFGPIDQQGAFNFVSQVSAKTGGAVLTGGNLSSDGKYYNSSMLYTAEGEDLQFYNKVHLVPFGEYIPGDKTFTWLQKFAPVSSCTPGELRPLLLRDIPLGVAICFEDTDSAQMRALAAMGSRALVFITNDSWFSRSSETEQHAWQAVARAIETGRPVIRVGNSGVTGTIASDGKASWLLGGNGKPLVDRRGTMFDRVRLADGAAVTPYMRLGDWPLGIMFTLLMAGVIVVKYKNYEKRRFVPVQFG